MKMRGWLLVALLCAIVQRVECFFGTVSGLGVRHCQLMLSSPCRALSSRGALRRGLRVYMSENSGDDTDGTSVKGNARAPSESAVASLGKVEELANFGIRCMFTSRLYIGSPELHLALPLPTNKDSYPGWVPSQMRSPSLDDEWVDNFTRKAIENGWITQGGVEDTYEIRYGILRALVPKERCEVCNQAVKQRKQNQAAEALQNIGTEERYRRASIGYALYLVTAVTGILSVVSDAGPLTRYILVCLPGLVGYAFTESGRTGL